MRLSSTLLSLLLAVAPLACSETQPSRDNPPHAAGPDYAGIQEEVRQRDQAIAEAFREEQGDLLPATAEDVIARHLEAVGGIEAFDSIQTLVLRFTAHGTSGTMGELVRYHKKPLHYRQQMIGSARAGVTRPEEGR